MHESSGTAATQSDEQLLEKINALEERVTELEADRDRHREELHALARENHELRSSQERLEEHVGEAETERNELQGELERAEASRGHIIHDVVDIEQQLGEGQGAGMAPIERVSKMEAEDTAIEMTPSIERAVAIFDHWEEWSEKTPKGRVLKDGLKSLLRTATGEGLAWRQVYRAAEALEELSKGQLQFVDHSDHGKMLIQPNPARSGDCRLSSAATS
jgi:regulator of replication initiation timing